MFKKTLRLNLHKQFTIYFTLIQSMEVGVNGQVDPAPRPVEMASSKEPVHAPTQLQPTKALLVLDLVVKVFFAIPKSVLVLVLVCPVSSIAHHK